MKVGYAKIGIKGFITKDKPYEVLDETDHEYKMLTDSGKEYYFPKRAFYAKKEKRNSFLADLEKSDWLKNLKSEDKFEKYMTKEEEVLPKLVQFDFINNNNVTPNVISSSKVVELTDKHFNTISQDSSKECTNDGGRTNYYQFKKHWEQIQDVIEDRNMNFSQGNILKAAFTFNLGRHDGTDYKRELNKIIFFANRELERIK